MEELLKALHTIQDECKRHDEDGCHKCPLFSKDSQICGVTDLDPSNWCINDYPFSLLV